MRLRTPKILLALLLLSGSAGYANPSYDFSYQFGTAPTDTFGGTITGTDNSGLVTIDSLVSVWFNDPTQKRFDVTVLGGWSSTTSGWDATAVMSTKLLSNNFGLTTPDGFTFYFIMAPDGTGDVTAMGGTASGVFDYDSLTDPSQVGVWTFKQQGPISSVPDGGSTAVMLVISCAALGLLRRRR